MAHNLFSGLEVVLGDGLFEVSARTHELARIHVNDGHGLGAVDHKRSTAGEVDLAVERLLNLFGHTEFGERIHR